MSIISLNHDVKNVVEVYFVSMGEEKPIVKNAMEVKYLSIIK